MRSGSALLLVLLLSSHVLSSGGTEGINHQSKECCFELFQMKLPLKKIVSYRHTSSNCPSSAVIFKMMSGMLVCMDPKTKWVKDHMNKMDQRKQHPQKKNPPHPKHFGTNHRKTM
ncbi:monocyte chemotactic protein 1B-like [Astyanax mexicanus]|uniref:Monocyte chemotactic protein 1B-like n=1 Tax=Astyanax mexicanus TaxID=7994 RepID=A0A8T2LJQ1_ASTMX|nr:monocyte chemotactic protein 1B-like [Astyanax mexicanus]